VRRAGNQSVRLAHRHHHGAEKVRLEQRLARLRGAHSFVAVKGVKPPGEIFQVLAGGGVNHADALERDVQSFGGFLYFGVVAEHDGCAEPQRLKLPGRLQDTRLFAFGKHHPLGMPLQFFDDAADETHDNRLPADSGIVNSIWVLYPIDALVGRASARAAVAALWRAASGSSAASPRQTDPLRPFGSGVI